MALKKYYLTTTAEATKTLKSDANGLLFNFLLFNLNTNSCNIKLYLEDDNNNELIIFNDTISAGQKLYFEEKYSLEGEDIKVYSDKNNVQVLIQILDNQ